MLWLSVCGHFYWITNIDRYFLQTLNEWRKKYVFRSLSQMCVSTIFEIQRRDVGTGWARWATAHPLFWGDLKQIKYNCASILSLLLSGCPPKFTVLPTPLLKKSQVLKSLLLIISANQNVKIWLSHWSTFKFWLIFPYWHYL